MKFLYNNIKKVEAIDSYHLQHSDIISERGVYLNVTQVFEPIDLVGLASCEISDKMENNTRIFSIKLQMNRLKPLHPGNRSLCFRLTTVTGSQFLMGGFDKPYPVISNDESMPSSPASKSGAVTTVTLQSTLPLLAILD